MRNLLQRQNEATEQQQEYVPGGMDMYMGGGGEPCLQSVPIFRDIFHHSTQFFTLLVSAPLPVCAVPTSKAAQFCSLTLTMQLVMEHILPNRRM